MKAPDKIVLPYAAGEMQFLIDPVVYIRKDALLEWAKAVKADPMIPMNIDKVIEKIESL